MKLSKIFAALTAAMLFLFCVYPVHDDSDALEEQQSVWQYLKVFSIYHGRLPQKPGSLTPENMFAIINDSLGNGRYTEYYNGFPGGGGGNPSVFDDPWEISDSTVYIRISDFWERDLQYFGKHTAYMSDFPNIIIDLRYNTGGYLSVVDSMVSEFLPKGTRYIKTTHRVYDSDRREGRTETEEKKTKISPLLPNKNIIILMNHLSASASEIMASGLKDGANATLVGSATYGKGIGQYTITRGGRQGLRITFMEIEGLPDGKVGQYHKLGIPPDPVPPIVKGEADAFAAFWCSHVYGSRGCPKNEPFETYDDVRDEIIAILLAEPDYFGQPALLKQTLTKLRQSKPPLAKRVQGPIGVIVVGEDLIAAE